ncbi:MULTISPECIES: hydroxymethylglutaryl-CoA reductase [unclassified Marinobacterium]|uniref:hydroxymethylglutaryl-CoA reductase n=1 Tax=unclassified Marinobacterium TaxID=2644139 RepID=UPI0015683E86|nr:MULTISPECIES: hydroxymethylglutaryl-CoA reductase [unclassified Marinobacterium]NRP10941.1 Hydroxymethylglutaryl-coenzyme A reductase [Marinobacterium sp. xm-g-48]NRP37364.1 Hydroxymethylglutaryl-coenzyme A reductase [Marinobacterium sp. xm-d-579]NRP58262.1 Hydroxymethylglutaryl-coenzyme A reductase [Marinobacterium sp. xm-d-510]NRP95636.1 Hydroxymethylglutaryl-coenzyme A reductase [Marinobacterium sp. xm-g-59]NRP97386.1 Hydroxymethylglutaryl-coenzyme A reductase [Marinobacterium sp. xm-a-1
MKTHKILQAPIPMRWVGPMKLSGHLIEEKLSVPLATYETPLWPSVGRGARISTLCEEGIKVSVIDERMTRSILLEAEDAYAAHQAIQSLKARMDDLNEVVAKSSRFAKLIDINSQVVGNLIYLRLEFTTGDASGHNMVTNAADHLIPWILTEYPHLQYSSISGNYCSDKKATAVNGILGRGKYVVCEILIPRDIVERRLHSTPEKIVDLNIKKNLIGTMIAGGLRSANAHYANMLLAFYLATGQDAANIIEGSQGVVHAEVRNGDLYFSCTLPNLIVGSVGNGKGIDFVEENLERLGCRDDREPGANARRLAAICGATVLCGELSLIAAQTNPGELMQSHLQMERK